MGEANWREALILRGIVFRNDFCADRRFLSSNYTVDSDMMDRNAEIVGLRFGCDPQELWENRLAESTNDSWIDSELNTAKELACIAHFVVGNRTVVSEKLRLASDRSVRYFRENEKLDRGWFKVLSRGMLVSFLARRRSNVVALCDRVRIGMRVEDHSPLPDEIQVLYLLLAREFQSNPSGSSSRWSNRLTKSRKKAVNLLRDSLHAVQTRDNDKFANSIAKYVAYHRTKPKPDPHAFFVEDWLPLHANVVFLAGLELGLKHPGYSDDVSAFLLTPESTTS